MESKIKLSIDNLGCYGEGVGKHEGYTVFVEGALPGEMVTAQLFKREKRYGKAKLLSVESPSLSRVTPPCPVFERCGGCQIMHLDYQEQLRIKRQKVIDALERIGKMDVEVLPCIPSPSELSYRNKIQVPIRDGKMGFYARSSNDLIDVESCQIHCSIGEEVYTAARKILNGRTLKALIIKTAVSTKEVLIVLVTMDGCEQLAKELMKIPHVKGVVQNLNGGEDNVVLGKNFKVLEGSSFITEVICGLQFKVSPASFFQVNPAQAENLYTQTVAYAALTGEETVLDAYCGVGTLSLLLAKKAKRVVGVECVEEAVVDAKENARLNGIKHVEFYCDTLENYIRRAEKMDLCVLNPPRKGCDAALIAHLLKLKPEKVIYISCDPATLARDLALLEGYSIKRVQPFDMFPQTAHVETLTLLTRGE